MTFIFDLHNLWMPVNSEPRHRRNANFYLSQTLTLKRITSIYTFEPIGEGGPDRYLWMKSTANERAGHFTPSSSGFCDKTEMTSKMFKNRKFDFPLLPPYRVSLFIDKF